MSNWKGEVEIYWDEEKQWEKLLWRWNLEPDFGYIKIPPHPSEPVLALIIFIPKIGYIKFRIPLKHSYRVIENCKN